MRRRVVRRLSPRLPTLVAVPTDWSSQLSDLAVRRAVGPRAFLTGASYVQGNRVRELTVDPGGKLLFGSVQGRNEPPTASS